MALVHVVSSGESLSRIAQKYTGKPLRWPELLELNPALKRAPDMIVPGMRLTLPDTWTVEQAPNAAFVTLPKNPPQLDLGGFSANAFRVTPEQLTAARSQTSLLPDAFFPALLGLASELKMNPADLLRVMAKESSLNPHAYNADSNAGGLLGLTEVAKNAAGWRGSLEEFRELGAVAQLPYWRKYFLSQAPVRSNRPYEHAGAVYLAVFAPARMKLGDSMDVVLYDKKRDGASYTQNEFLDEYTVKPRVPKGYITTRDLFRYLLSSSNTKAYNAALVRLSNAAGRQMQATLPSLSNAAAGFATVGTLALLTVGVSLIAAALYFKW